MAEPVLTEERRNALAALLDDEQRLRVEYPKLLEYLDMSQRLSGTGDERADSAFDLRFVHYVTGGLSESSNPYWDIVAPSVFEYDGRYVVNGGRRDGSGRLAFAGMILQSIYAYAIPSPGTLKWISEFCAGRSVIELGAGRGYWAAQLANLGLNVSAYDIEPPDKTDNASFPRTGQCDVWYGVHRLEDFVTCFADVSNDVLFLCWPPGWGDAMASHSLAEFENSGGDRLIFVGEPKGGKTGDNAFFDALATNWKLQSEYHGFVSWWNLSDVAQAWVR